MANITILKHETDSTEIPRPFNLACSELEALEMLGHWLTAWSKGKVVTDWTIKLAPENLDTDLPILEVRPASHGHYTGPGLLPAIKFYAVTEELYK